MFVSVKERLPETRYHHKSSDMSAEWDMSDLVLVYAENNDKNDKERVYFLARYYINSDGSKYFLDDENIKEIHNVLFWAPLPELSILDT